MFPRYVNSVSSKSIDCAGVCAQTQGCIGHYTVSKRFCYVVGPDVTKPPGHLIGNPFKPLTGAGVGPITQTGLGAGGATCFRKLAATAATTVVPVTTTKITSIKTTPIKVTTSKTPTTKLTTTTTEAAATGIVPCQTGRQDCPRALCNFSPCAVPVRHRASVEAIYRFGTHTNTHVGAHRGAIWCDSLLCFVKVPATSNTTSSPPLTTTATAFKTSATPATTSNAAVTTTHRSTRPVAHVT